MSFPTSKSIYISRYVRKPTRIASRASKITVTSIKGNKITWKIETKDFDQAGKPLPRKKPAKGKKTSMISPEGAPGHYGLAALPISVAVFGLLLLLWGARRRK